VVFLGTEGWIHVDRQNLTTHPEELVETKFAANEVQLFASSNHHANFVAAAQGRGRPAAPIDVAVGVEALCNLQQIAIKLNRKLRWDPAKEDFADDAEASRMLDRPMRAPWKI
jgi:hypothetical protein